ncbi:AAC(3) family N-acetyltransferase [Achromobacter sp. Root83]|uniref:AAC(3) family N-acetyltransferase n=1 Tax=Achromobacter sp. Root83 TaxID=1736602 RepID=UPI00070DC401|nr:AAC(3) family N-acetyltransferase [Achromobacter sp. Root83]
MSRIGSDDLIASFREMGIAEGDTVLIRAGLGAVGRIDGGANAFIGALLRAVGPEGTIMSLAFTDTAFIRRPDPENRFHVSKKSYAGALPNAMIEYEGAERSRHPMCSYVAIGKQALRLTQGHGPESPAYEPIRTLIELRGKCMLVGCVQSSPGFTTTHLAEVDLGLSRRVIFPWLNSTFYEDERGQLKLFRRRDPGMCSSSFYKMYGHYVAHGLLRTGMVGAAYSIIGPAAECYQIDCSVLQADPKFTICDSPTCITCNALRWDRLHRMPLFAFNMIKKRFQ